jgi:electron transport complex protein RnfG
MNHALKMSLRTAGMMLVFTLAFTGFMAAIYNATKSEIAASAQQAKLKLINEVLPPDRYDNVLLDDYAVIPATPELGLSEPSRIYRARKAGAPVALVFEAAAADGYSGRIGLLIAVGADGRVSGVRVTEHKETPGLGDYIDPNKDKNKTRPWITQFNGRGLNEVPQAAWQVKKDGGQFDYMTGATISARAVSNAVGRAVQFASAQREALFAAATPRN